MTRDMGEEMDTGMTLVEVGQTPKGKVLVDRNREEARSNFVRILGLGVGQKYTGRCGWAPQGRPLTPRPRSCPGSS